MVKFMNGSHGRLCHSHTMALGRVASGVAQLEGWGSIDDGVSSNREQESP